MKYIVHLASVPGMFSQYAGHIEVEADDEAQACQVALRRLRSGAFTDRCDAMWHIERVERVMWEIERAG